MENPQISVVIVTFGRDSLYSLVKKLSSQKIAEGFEIVIVSEKPLDESLFDRNRVKIFYEPSGKGIPYYRNAGIRHSSGQIIAFIDDDEEPEEHWLSKITLPLTEGKDDAATSGYRIPLGQGYLADSISLLGFPGGGGIGFRTMWNVDENFCTKHLCTGNFAVRKNLIESVGMFDESLKFGAEDVELAQKLPKIRYVDDATILHEARSGLLKFIRWQVKRGRSVREFHKLGKLKNSYAGERMSSLKKIIKNAAMTRYFPMVAFLMVNQYLWNSVGYAIESLDERQSAKQ
jgi:glycosyltransferase involved in cell wall biosynthesis